MAEMIFKLTWLFTACAVFILRSVVACLELYLPLTADAKHTHILGALNLAPVRLFFFRFIFQLGYFIQFSLDSFERGA